MKNVSVVLVILAFSILAGADEGMWTFDNLPTQILKDRYGFVPPAGWAEHIMKSSVRFNSGGSGSFVSSTGLVITNHHVGADTLEKISTPTHNFYEEGFYAKSHWDEFKAPDLEINQLVSIEDVTAKVNAVVKPGMAPAKAFELKKAVMNQIEKESTTKTGLRSDVVTLYNGALYHLYRYKKYKDVRLVFAPEFKAAFFGGDPDNFEYPRYDLDICIFRVYENDKPAKIDNFLSWSPTGPKDDDLIFVSGNPGSTNRLYTLAALRAFRDVRLPLNLEHLYRMEIALQQYMGKGDEQARRGQEDYFSIQNSRKANLGRLQGLHDPKVFATKEDQEKTLQQKISQNPKLKKYLSAWKKVADIQKEYEKILIDYIFLEKAWGFNSRLFNIARTLVRLAEEDQKPNEQRLREYSDAARDSLNYSLFSPAPIYNDLEIAELRDSLSYLVEKMGIDSPRVKEILAGQSVVDRAADLVNNSKLQDVALRKSLATGGSKAILASNDAMIKLALLVDPASRAVRKLYDDKVDGASQEAYGQISKAKFAIYGTNDYPDATFTPRLAFGLVRGYDQDGTSIPATTTLGGAFDHEKEHGAKDPFLLPKRWHDKKGKLDLQVPFNFVSTADIIGGNSGSPVVNKAGDFVGIIFDGNIQSLPLQYIYSESQARAVSVSSGGITEALNKIFEVPALVKELGH